MSTKKSGSKQSAKTSPAAPEVVPAELQPPVEPVTEPSELPETELQQVVEPPVDEKPTLSLAQELVEKYRASYPDNKVFYVTSDMQLFLSNDYNMALLHQKTIKGELETVTL